MRLRFGNLEDLIMIKKEELRILQVEYNFWLIQEGDNVEKCNLRLAGIKCSDCFLEKQCREDSAKTFAMVDAIEAEMDKIILNLRYLHLELFIKRNKGVHIKYTGLELFPNG
jgi:hypothetical protein